MSWQKREHLMKFLEGELGNREHPSGSNQIKYNDWYYEKPHAYFKNPRPYAWCGTFVAYAYHFSDIYVPTDLHKVLCYVPSAQNLLVKMDARTESPKAGDIVIFDWNRDGFEEHIGIFSHMKDGKAVCIEGNTSPDEKGSQSNGGMVCQKSRSLSLIEGFYNIIDNDLA